MLVRTGGFGSFVLFWITFMFLRLDIIMEWSCFVLIHHGHRVALPSIDVL